MGSVIFSVSKSQHRYGYIKLYNLETFNKTEKPGTLDFLNNYPACQLVYFSETNSRTLPPMTSKKTFLAGDFVQVSMNYKAGQFTNCHHIVNQLTVKSDEIRNYSICINTDIS
jgi:hypothetical protein